MIRTRVSFALCGMVSGPALAADLNVTLQIPQLDVAEYHRPYVAVWLEGANGVTNLSVWYDVEKKDGGGTKWLKDMRQWWRKSGRELSMPVDGVSGATRIPGEHTLNFSGQKAPLASLKPGDYKLTIEAAREVGGREILSVPLHWPPKEAQQLKAQGEHELGTVTIGLSP